MANDGQLTWDRETDASGARYVTRSSVQAELQRRTRRRRTTVPRAALQAAAGLTPAGIDALVRATQLVPATSAQLTLSSVRRWATAFRPELLEHPLLATGVWASATEERGTEAAPAGAAVRRGGAL
jgi:hypothetical protein